MNNSKAIMFFDSGLGGLSILRQARVKIPQAPFIYVADDLYFPYGSKSSAQLKAHILQLFEFLIEKFNPVICVIACNTASTLVLSALRKKFPYCSFVGTVPAIKLGAKYSKSKLISVLATKGTISRDYTKKLIEKYASDCEVTLVGSDSLASLSENYLRGEPIEPSLLQHEILPCFIKKQDKKTDIIVLACTHYPFLISEMRKIAPWPVDWLDASEPIARRIKSLYKDQSCEEGNIAQNLAYFTSQKIDNNTEILLQAFGLNFTL